MCPKLIYPAALCEPSELGRATLRKIARRAFPTGVWGRWSAPFALGPVFGIKGCPRHSEVAIGAAAAVAFARGGGTAPPGAPNAGAACGRFAPSGPNKGPWTIPGAVSAQPFRPFKERLTPPVDGRTCAVRARPFTPPAGTTTTPHNDRRSASGSAFGPNAGAGGAPTAKSGMSFWTPPASRQPRTSSNCS